MKAAGRKSKKYIDFSWAPEQELEINQKRLVLDEFFSKIDSKTQIQNNCRQFSDSVTGYAE
jgi:hypothetical protein